MREIRKIAGKPVLMDVLECCRATHIQGHMNRNQRHANVDNAFHLNPRCAAQVKGKTVTLIDDALTTGATVNECSGFYCKRALQA